jgi:hypothetical protein
MRQDISELRFGRDKEVRMLVEGNRSTPKTNYVGVRVIGAITTATVEQEERKRLTRKGKQSQTSRNQKSSVFDPLRIIPSRAQNILQNR